MRSTLSVLCLLLASSVFGLGIVLEPDGSSRPVGEIATAGGSTLAFSARTVPERSWIALPAGAQVTEVVLIGSGFRQKLLFPTVQAPRLRFAFEVPAHVLSVTIRGRLSPSPVLTRSLARPSNSLETWVSTSATDVEVDLAPWSVPVNVAAEVHLTTTGSQPWRASFSTTGHARTFRLSSRVQSWGFLPRAWGFVPTRVLVSGEGRQLEQLRIRTWSAKAALPADTETLLNWPQGTWRSHQREWFQWDAAKVLVLVTDSYETQDAYLKRLAFFVEKTGYRGKLVGDAQLSGLHGWNAHDYGAADLARFFSLSVQQGFSINSSELELRDRLLAYQVLVARDDGSFGAGQGALIGVSAASAPALRRVLFVHEAFHGLYFTSEAFQRGAKQAWDGLSEGARSAFRQFLALSSYDPTDEGLMINEFQAYVLQRGSTQWPSFFKTRVLAKYTAGRGDVWSSEYLLAAQSLDHLVQDLFGVQSGTTSLVTTP